MASKHYCPQCGHTGTPKTHTRGSILIELILWLCFLVPGLIYSIWRLTTRAEVCALCGQPGVIPANSPVARKALGGAPPGDDIDRNSLSYRLGQRVGKWFK